MSDPKAEPAGDYGESDLEAEAMDDAAGAAPKQPAGAGAVPPDQSVPASGTTETDVADNLRDVAERETKS